MVALGYNVSIHDRVELVSHIVVDIPQAREKAAGMDRGMGTGLTAPGVLPDASMP